MPRKNAVPAIKTCAVCQTLWIPKTRYQAARNQTCSQVCKNTLIGSKNEGKQKVALVVCATCGKPTKPRPPCHQKRRQSPLVYCSRSCWGKTRKVHMKSISPLGLRAVTPEARKLGALRGPLNGAWKGGATYRKRHGNYVSVKYVRCPPAFQAMARKDGYVMEHRLVMAMWVGRPLTRTETVHHIDHKPLNNPRSNLELWPDNRSHKLAEHGQLVEGAVNQLFLTA